jgi:hypothetical protein
MSHFYLSGPISGKPKGNIMEFERAAQELRQHGYKIVSPVELDQKEQICTEEVEAGSKEWRFLLARDIEIITSTETQGLFVLPGWQDSRGARLEVHVAMELGKPVVSWPERVSLYTVYDNGNGASNGRHPTSERFHSILKELGALHDKKAADYGTDQDPLANVRASSEWGIAAWVGAMTRGQDKVTRLKTFATKGKLENESVIDAFNDLAVYATLARILYEEENAAP